MTHYLFAIYDKDSNMYSAPNCFVNDDMAMRWFFGVLDGMPDYVRSSLQLYRVAAYENVSAEVNGTYAAVIADGSEFEEYMKHRRPASAVEEK